MTLLRKFQVSGHSMVPALKPGWEILVSSLPYIILKPKIGELVAFKDGGKIIVKRIKVVGEDEILTEGDNREDSKEYGWIAKKQIVGKVIHIIGT